MGFKLGKNRGLEATNGEIKTKLRFGRQPHGEEGSIPGTPIIAFMQPAPLFFGQDPMQKMSGKGLVK